MGLIDDLVSRILNPIIDRIKAALGPFGKLFDLIGKFFTGFRDSFNKSLQLSNLITSEIHAWVTFKEDIHFRTSVINIPIAIEKTKQLIDEIQNAWHAIIDIGQQIKKQASGQTESPTEEAIAAEKDIQASGIKTLLEKLPRLAKGLERILGFLAIAIGVLESVQSGIDDLTDIVTAIKDLRLTIEEGAIIFLQQKNPRKTVQLADGSSMRLRVGTLHPS